MEARQIPAGNGRLISEATGEIEKDGKVLVVKRIHVRYHLQLDESMRETAVRAHDIHANYCPVARTIRDCVDITTSLHMEGVE
ncbi:MAG: OsmC family protein [Anaerolineae bacterium]